MFNERVEISNYNTAGFSQFLIARNLLHTVCDVIIILCVVLSNSELRFVLFIY